MNKVWYRLTNNDDIDMLFSDYTSMQNFWKNFLSTEQALQCYWEVEEV